MPIKQFPVSDTEFLTQVAGLTGLGWTASILLFLSTVLGYGDGLVARLFIEPQLLLLLGGIFLVATLWLDRRSRRLSNERE